MRRRRLGRTGLQVSEIGLGGAWLLGRQGDLPMEAGVVTIRRALELGVNYLDTAECYIGGRSEEVFGLALEQVDGDCFLATKFGHQPEDFDFSRQSVVESIAESRRRLRGRTIDLIQIHTPPEPSWESLFGPNGALDGMREARERGWCHRFGITGRDVEFLRRCIETDAFDTVLLFWRYDLLEQSGVPILADAAAHDMGVILGSPLRMGLFGSAREEMWPHLDASEQRRAQALETLFASEPGGVTAGAIRFALFPPEVSVVLSGAASPQEIETAVAASEVALSPEIAQAVMRIGTEV